MFQVAILDFDVLIYRCGFSIEKYDKHTETLTVEPFKNGCYNINSMVRSTLTNTGATSYQSYLTGNEEPNFRVQIYDAYKANRKDVRRPHYYNDLRKFATSRWGATMSRGEEADDTACIAHCELNPLGFDESTKTSVLCTIDKDFNNVPGWHYHYVNQELYFVSEIQALRNFYLQILTGDTSDNIPRIKRGWRQGKTEEKIQQADTEQELLDIVKKEVYTIYKWKDEQIIREITWRGQLVWLRRQRNQMWLPPS